MWQSLVFGFLGGLMAANGIPHFITGITRRRYPTVFGGGPVINVAAGWLAVCIAAGLMAFAELGEHPLAGGVAIAVGVLPMALFHAGGGAFAVGRA